MKALIDTNIFLEIILAQEKEKIARELIKTVDSNDFFISDFSLHSIGLYLFRHNKKETFNKFVSDIINNAGFKVASLSADDLKKISKNVKQYNLDFDDGYQYVAAEKYELQIVTFDSDFDNTDKGRKIPSEVISTKF